MKTLTTTYALTASPVGKVRITNYPNITLDQILLITNVTSNTIIYNFADPTKGGTNAFLTIDAQTGGAMALQGDLDKDIDSVTTFDIGYGSVSNFLSGSTLGTAITGVGTQVLSANSNRITLFGQNLGTLPLYIKYGLGCNQSSFNFMLYPGTAAYDGRGEKFSDDRYKGDVSVNTLSGFSSQYIFWEGV